MRAKVFWVLGFLCTASVLRGEAVFSTSLTDAMRIAVTNDTVVNPVDNGVQGAWSFYQRTADGVNTLLAYLYVDTNVVSGCVRGLAAVTNPAAKIYPRLAVNLGESAVLASDCSVYTVNPGEAFLHPDITTHVLVRYTAGRSGLYSFTAVVRDLNRLTPDYWAGYPGTEGVNFTAYVNSNQVETVFVTRSEEAMAKSGLKLFPGDRIDFVLDANGQHSYDATGLTLGITCDEAHDEWRKYSLYTAAMENLKSATPTAHFTGSDGGVWTMGTYGLNAGFTPDQFTQGDVVYNGAWGGFTKSGSDKYPYMMINTNGVAGTVWDVTTTDAKEFAHHPANENTYSLARFHAPTDGVYRMTGYLKSLNASTT
ncbi:MAG: hypothetical protein PHV28_04210, partial [Kiritimatiellae bacterium]|nr:hypothetical protein [Kiritimatiellia bacterium]